MRRKLAHHLSHEVQGALFEASTLHGIQKKLRSGRPTKRAVRDTSYGIAAVPAYNIQLDLPASLRPMRFSEPHHSTWTDSFDFVPTGHLTLDSNGLILEASHNATMIFGLDRLQLVGQSLAFFLSKKDSRKLQNHIQKCAGKRQRSVTNVCLITPAGDSIAVRLSTTATAEVSNSTPTFQSTISEVVRPERKRHSLHIHRQTVLAELSQMAIAGADLNPLFENVVRMLTQAFGVELSFLLEFHPESNSCILLSGAGFDGAVIGRVVTGIDENSPLGQTLASTRPIVTVLAGKGADCPEFLRDERVRTVVTLSIPGHIRPYGILGISTRHGRRFNRDELNFLRAIANVLGTAIERNRMERALRESERMVRLITENMRDAVLTYDMAGTLRYVNPAFESLTGFVFDDVKNQLPLSHHEPADHARMRDLWPTLFQGKMYSDIEYRIRTKDGALKWCSGTWGPLVDEAGTQIGVQGREVDITEKKQAKELLEQSLRDKINILLQEIHHRVKNNLQIVSSLLNLQSGYVKDEATLGMFRECQNRIRSMALIHEKLYQSNELTKIDFGDYVRTLTANLLASYHIDREDIGLEVEADHSLLDLRLAVPCGLIINELVSNSLKHAFHPSDSSRKSQNPRIWVKLEGDSRDEFTLFVGDNGSGLPPDLDISQTKSLGLRLVRTLANQLDGTIEVSSGCGTEWKLIVKRNRL